MIIGRITNRLQGGRVNFRSMTMTPQKATPYFHMFHIGTSKSVIVTGSHLAREKEELQAEQEANFYD